MRGTPAGLAQPAELLPVTGEPDRRAEPASRPGTPAPRPAPAAPATTGPPNGPDNGPHNGQHQGPHNGPEAGAGIPLTPGSRNAADQDSSGEPVVIRDLQPPPVPAPGPIAMPGPEAGEPHQKPRVPGPAPRVSIGTIEVTVLPPAPPVSPAPGIRPPAQVARGRTRPSSLFAATAGADRRRDGLRRWYGTAQG